MNTHFVHNKSSVFPDFPILNRFAFLGEMQFVFCKKELI